MTTNLFVIANVKQLRTGGSFKILLPFFRTSLGVGVLNSSIFNNFHNRVEFEMILEGLRNFGGFETLTPPPSVRHCEAKCLLRGTDWVFKSDRYSFVLTGSTTTHSYPLITCTTLCESGVWLTILSSRYEMLRQSVIVFGRRGRFEMSGSDSTFHRAWNHPQSSSVQRYPVNSC